MSEAFFDLQPTLTGDLLVLRPLQASDLEDLYKAASDPLIWDQPYTLYKIDRE
jgi:N-acetyltransferase